MFRQLHKPHWKLNQLRDCSFSLFTVTYLPHVSKMVTIISPRHCSRIKRNYPPPPLSFQTSLFVAIKFWHACQDKILLEQAEESLCGALGCYRKSKMYLGFQFGWMDELVRTWRASNSFKNPNYFCSVLPVPPFPSSRQTHKLWGRELLPHTITISQSFV